MIINEVIKEKTKVNVHFHNLLEKKGAAGWYEENFDAMSKP